MTRYYTVKQTSLILGFSTNSIYKFLANGRLKGNRGNSELGRFQIPHSSLEKFLGTKIDPNALARALNSKGGYKTQVKKGNGSQTVIPTKSVTPTPSNPINHSATTHKVIRGLIIVGLVMILIELLVSQNFSLFQQFMRLTLMAILIVITYQFGDSPQVSHES